MSYEIACTFVAESDAAVCIIEHVAMEKLWIPLSQVEEIHGRRPDGTGEGTIVMTDWIARKKGLL